MENMIAIEASHIINELPDFLEVFVSVTNPHQQHENLFIFPAGTEADNASYFLEEAGMLAGIHTLVKVSQGQEGADFYDTGFIVGSAIYLFKDLLTAFKFKNGNKMQIEMSLLQMEEHLSFTAFGNNGQSIHFAHAHYEKLITGIAKAYEVGVEFLDLDK
ncbi:hypothetical protein [Bacillus sp. REN3]|uniref:hypothetical protein n=1 Tax=Bacillus sp. REN3 TaxID=2802440 RepID=UPI001AEED067|nr:hypothetical protein [Bacillus sp. REN3]